MNNQNNISNESAKKNPLESSDIFLNPTNPNLCAHLKSPSNEEDASKKQVDIQGNKEDVAIITLLKNVWSQHRDDPDVVAALKSALDRGIVTPEEVQKIEASAAFAVAKKTQNAQSFEKVEEDPKLLAEAIYLKKILDPSCLASLALDDILKDGKVTKEEMKAFAKAYLTVGDKQNLILAAEADRKKEQEDALRRKNKAPGAGTMFSPPKPSFADIPKK